MRVFGFLGRLNAEQNGRTRSERSKVGGERRAPGTRVVVQLGLQVTARRRFIVRVVCALQRHRYGALHFLRPAAVIAPLSISASALSRLIFDQMLLQSLAVNRSADSNHRRRSSSDRSIKAITKAPDSIDFGIGDRRADRRRLRTAEPHAPATAWFLASQGDQGLAP